MSSAYKLPRSRRTICLTVVAGLFCFLLVAQLARHFYGERPACFVVDALRAETRPSRLEPLRVPGADEPIAFGTICFYPRQELVEWDVRETFDYAYDNELFDFSLHGPLASKQANTAPALVQMGVMRYYPSSPLRGTRHLSSADIFALLERPSAYYVALGVLSHDARSSVEVARSVLRHRARV